MRSILTTVALAAALLPQQALAVCFNFQCNDAIQFAFVDEKTEAVWLQTADGDEGNLDCSPPGGPDPLHKGVPLERRSPIFVEAYQVVLLATASQLPVQINFDPSDPDCRINGIVLDPFRKLP
jgi:hypothetical protein